MANQDGIKIPICEDDMGEGFKELWRDYAETIRLFDNPFINRFKSEELKKDEPEEPKAEKPCGPDYDCHYRKAIIHDSRCPKFRTA